MFIQRASAAMFAYMFTKTLLTSAANANQLVGYLPFFSSSLPVAHMSDAPRGRLVVTRDSARIQGETT